MRYQVNGQVTISVNVFVEADSEEEARAKAEEASMQTFCNGCATANKELDIWSTEELDGTPVVLEVIEAPEEDD